MHQQDIVGMSMWRKLIHGAAYGMAFGGMVLLVPMMLLTTGDVIGRAFWSRPIPGTVELSSYMLAVFILAGVAYTQRVKAHVNVTMLLDRMPERVSDVINICTTILSLVIIGVLAWQGWVVGMEETTVSDQLRVPQWPFRLLVSLGGVFCAWNC
jgi:TRAP-type C4-dicarboxylate transport system permease small subunit